MAVVAVVPPKDGVWRIGRAPDPLARAAPMPPEMLDQPATGNRFDSPTGSYSALYFGTTLDVCYGETLARFRPDPQIRELVGEEWAASGFMEVGEVPSDWRQRRLAVQVQFAAEGPKFSGGIRFLDVESLDTREVLREELGQLLALLGHSDLDVAVVRGGDRRVTRAIGHWAYTQADEDGVPLYAGIRYLSRLNTDWECWAVFDDVPMVEIVRRPILLRDDALRRVTKRFRLRPH